MKKTPVAASLSLTAGRSTAPMAQSAALSGIPRLRLARVRSLSGMTQVDLAARLGIKQNNVSKLETRDDMMLSTLRNYLVSMGAEIEILARVNGNVVLLDIPLASSAQKHETQPTAFD